MDIAERMDELIEALTGEINGNLSLSEDDLYGILQVLTEKRDAEIAKQPTDEAVKDAIAWANHEHSRCMVNLLFGDADCASLAITALQQMQGWIPTSDRLPKERDEVICYDLEFGVMQAQYKFEIWWLDNDSWIAEYVTHWMPLPEPPKGE